MHSFIEESCKNKEPLKGRVDHLFIEPTLTTDHRNATFVLFQPSIQTQDPVLVMKQHLHQSYAGQKIYLQNDEALNLMLSHNVKVLKPRSFVPATLTVVTAFTVILPLLRELIAQYMTMLTMEPASLLVMLAFLALYCMVIYPLLSLFMNRWNPSVYLKFNASDLIKEGAKIFSLIAVRLIVLTGTTFLGLPLLTVDAIVGTAVAFFEEILVGVEKNFSNWTTNPWAILSNISRFLVNSVHNTLLSNITGFLKEIWGEHFGHVALVHLVNTMYNVTYSFTLGKLILTSMGELQQYCLYKEKGIGHYNCVSPRQWFPDCVNSAFDIVTGCVGASVTSIGGCFGYLGRQVVDCTNPQNISKCLMISGIPNQETSPLLVTQQPSTSYGSASDSHSVIFLRDELPTQYQQYYEYH